MGIMTNSKSQSGPIYEVVSDERTRFSKIIPVFFGKNFPVSGSKKGFKWQQISMMMLTPAVLLQYIPRNMHTVFALLCFVVVIDWLIFPYPSGLLHWHCGNLTIAPVPAKQPWWIWINTSCEFIMNDCITTTKQSTTKPCAYFLGYTVCDPNLANRNPITNTR